MKKEKWTGGNKHLPFWMLISEAQWDLNVVGSCWHHIKREFIIYNLVFRRHRHVEWRHSAELSVWSCTYKAGTGAEAPPAPHCTSHGAQTPYPLQPHSRARRTGWAPLNASRRAHHVSLSCWASAVSLSLSATKPSICIWKKKRTRSLCFPFQMWPAQTLYDNTAVIRALVQTV